MNKTLEHIISSFRLAQKRAVLFLKDELHIPMPSTNRQWLDICAEHKLHEKNDINGVGIYTHGYGIELTFKDISIDFDWGDHGENNGFDLWRLWNHCQNNKLFMDQCTYQSIDHWLMEALIEGELRKDTHLYYRLSED